MPTYPNPKTLTPFRSDVPASQQVNVGDKVVRVRDPYKQIPVGGIYTVKSADTEYPHVIFEECGDLFPMENFAPLPPEPIKTISKAEAEKLLAEKGVEVRIAE
jgi:hypothetical protein